MNWIKELINKIFKTDDNRPVMLIDESKMKIDVDFDVAFSLKDMRTKLTHKVNN